MDIPDPHTHPETEHVSGPVETAPEAELTSTESRQLADLLEVIRDKSYKGFSELDADEEHRIHPTVISAYMQDQAIARCLTQFQLDDVKTGNVQTVFDHMADTQAVNYTIRAGNEMHEMISGMANVMGVTRQEFTSNPDTWDINKLALNLGNDFFVFCKRGLISPDGDSSNFQQAAKRLRALNIVMLFSDTINQPDMADQYAELLRGGDMQDADPMIMAKAEELAGYYANSGFSAKILKRFREANTDNLNEIVNYTAQIMLAGITAGQISQVQDVEASRQKYREVLAAVGQSDLESITTKAVKILRELENANPTQETIVQTVGRARELQWEVLPPGELQKIAQEIVEAHTTETRRPTIDLQRLLILEQIRTEWGASDAYYARGVLGKRRVIKSDGQEEPDQYLLLVLKELDANGAVVAEHAIAESPITQNALYTFREDVSEGLTWQEVMALPKSYARALGARQVNHTLPRTVVPEGYLVTSMVTKIRTLLTATKEEFPLIEFSGERGHRIRVPKTVIVPPETDAPN